jgi:hypothetical protein
MTIKNTLNLKPAIDLGKTLHFKAILVYSRVSWNRDVAILCDISTSAHGFYYKKLWNGVKESNFSGR